MSALYSKALRCQPAASPALGLDAANLMICCPRTGSWYDGGGAGDGDGSGGDGDGAASAEGPQWFSASLFSHNPL